jgi:hypothetical protein
VLLPVIGVTSAVVSVICDDEVDCREKIKADSEDGMAGCPERLLGNGVALFVAAGLVGSKF